MLVKIASAFIGEADSGEPRIMIMDEPTRRPEQRRSRAAL